jgi:hypothetical protein
MGYFTDSRAFFPTTSSGGLGVFVALRWLFLAGEEIRFLSIKVLITICPIYNLFCKKLLMLYNVLIIGQGS